MGNCRKSCEFSSPARPRCLIQSASEFMEKDKSHRHVTYFSFYSPVDGAVPRCDVPFGTMRIVIINSQTVFPPMCAQSRAKFLGEWLTEVEWSIERVDLLALAVPLRESQVNLLFSHVQLGGSSVLFDVSLGRHQAAPDCGPYSSGYAERRMEAKQILRLASFLADVHPFFPAVPSAVSAPRPTSIGSSEPPVLFSRGSLESPASPRTRITKRIRFILYFASYQLVNYLQLISPPRDSSGFNPFSRPPYFYFIIFFFFFNSFIYFYFFVNYKFKGKHRQRVRERKNHKPRRVHRAGNRVPSDIPNTPCHIREPFKNINIFFIRLYMYIYISSSISRRALFEQSWRGIGNSRVLG